MAHVKQIVIMNFIVTLDCGKSGLHRLLKA